MMWVDYNYYTNSFKSNIVDEDKFESLSQEAQDYIVYLTVNKAQRYIDEGKHTDTIKRSVCYLVNIFNERNVKKEQIKTNDSTIMARGLKSETVISHSVSYQDASNTNIDDELDNIYLNLAYKKASQLLFPIGLLNRSVKCSYIQ